MTLTPLLILTIAIGFFLARALFEHDRPRRMLSHQAGAVTLPSIPEMMRSEEARGRGQEQIAAVGFILNADRRRVSYLGNHSRDALYSEIYVVRRDGEPQTLLYREHQDLDDVEGEEMARALAARLGVEFLAH